MSLLNRTETVLMLVFLISTMVSIGMQTRVADLRSLIGMKGFLVRVLVANFIVIPIAGIVFALVLPLEPHVAGALILLACTPGGLSAIQFTNQVKGGAAIAGATLGLLSFLAVFVSPFIIKLVLPDAIHMVIPYGRAMLLFTVFLVLPFIAGMYFLARFPGASGKISKLLALLSLIVFSSFMVVTDTARKAAAGEIGAAAALSMIAFILVSMAIGWMMGGPARETRQILATSSSMRNAVLCLAIVQSSVPGHRVLVPLIAFSLLMVPTNTLFTVYEKIQSKRRARKQA